MYSQHVCMYFTCSVNYLHVVHIATGYSTWNISIWKNTLQLVYALCITLDEE